MNRTKVFILFHTHTLDDDAEDVKIIGVYSTRELAEEAINRKKKMPGFSATPEGFHIDAYELDRDQWSEGYIVTK